MQRTGPSPARKCLAALFATVAALLTAGTVLLTAGAAHAAPAQAQPQVPAPTGPTAQGQFAYLAAQLRRGPVYISDELPRAVPRSTAPFFAAQARRLHVPTYVVVLPFATSGSLDSGLLAGIHDHLGRKGLYVALSEMGLSDVQAFGVSVPGAQDAKTATMYEMPMDATPREAFRHFADVLLSGQAPQRADQARARYGGAYNSHEPPALHTTQTDREDQSFLTGVAVVGVPLTALLITKYAGARRRSRRDPSAVDTVGSGAKPGGGAAPARPRQWPLLELGALALAALLAFTASRVFDDTTTGDGSMPTAADMRARVDRVAEGLRHDPLYVDPEIVPPLDAAQHAALRERIGGLPVPVLIAAVPMSTADESQGDEDLLAKHLHDRLRRDALFVLANPASGRIEIVNYGIHVDASYLYDRPRDLSSADPATAPLGSRLDRLLTYLSKAPRAARPGQPYDPPPAPDPVAQQKLPGLFAGDFRAGLFVGGLAAVLLFGLVVAVWALVRWLGRGRARAVAAAAAPVEPRRAWLRRTAWAEVDALTAELESVTELPEEARRRAWECLDAAALLADGDSDGRIDGDATPAGLACAIVLARAGRATVREPSAAAYVCHRNPLHGTAVEQRSKPPAGRRKVPIRPVCAACREKPGEVLRLYGADASGRLGHHPYPLHPGPLAALANGSDIDQLTRQVRESFGVN
ncbi:MULTISPECIES: hypothetical protein [unclassified Streptomyces]|uniref:hypothetical protein n=1 Tax=unclassified Streptomyces TaxID=2593676 RepID=UPI0019279E6F|nr:MULTISPECIES: hypothetical protein [unclassified Streptomyces]